MPETPDAAATRTDTVTDVDLDRYFAGELPDDARADLERWVEGDPRRREELEYLRAAWHELAGRRQCDEREVEDARRAVLGRLDLDRTVVRRIGQTTRTTVLSSDLSVSSRWWSGRRVYRAFAALGVCILGFIGAQWSRNVSPTNQRARVYATQAGQQAVLHFADGSHLTLAPESHLRVHDHDATREMTLTGEALLHVVHHPTTPFIIRTGVVTTRVLGTTFDVSYRPASSLKQSATRIILIEGRVSTGITRQTLLSANTIAWVTDSTVSTISEQRIPDATALTHWTEGRLVFHDAAVSDVLATVARWYDITFRMTDTTLAAEPLTATIDVHHSRTSTLALLASALGVRMQMLGDTVIVIPGASSRKSPETSLKFPQFDGHRG